MNTYQSCLTTVERKIPLWDRVQWRVRGVGYGKITRIVAEEFDRLKRDHGDFQANEASFELGRRVKRRLRQEYSSLWVTLAVAIAMKIIEIIIAEWWK